ncbi:MAG TPA: HAD-IC family P-type ATPase, partial [Candidatus Wallbacteria bacterium]|nr:HAD-IC family P-type ATPase [Candidatus Wallbacteria bacterium]
MQKHFWHSMSNDDVCKYWHTNMQTGLTKENARDMLEKIGYNRLKEKEKKPLIVVFFEQFNNFIIWTLIIAALVSALTGYFDNPDGRFFEKFGDFVAIMLIVVLNGLLGLFQEIKADAAIDALKKMSARFAKVIRNGELINIEAEELVSGDLIVLEEGDIVPADVKVFEAHRFSTSEAALTGESVAVMKQNVEMIETEAPLSERVNMAYMGTTVATGRAKGLVVNTGMYTELGKIAKSIDEIDEEDTPLQRKLEEFGKQVVYLCIIVCAVIFFIGIMRGQTAMLMNKNYLVFYFMTAVSLAVAAIPEGLPAITTIVMALGTQRMANKKAIIRKLAAVETLGCTTVICTDKTGTLTQNKMVLKKIYADGEYIDITGEGYELNGEFTSSGRKVSINHQNANALTAGYLLEAGMLCNNAKIKPMETDKNIADFVGDPTEVAFLVAGSKAGICIDEKFKEFELADEVPFSSERKMMSKIFKKDNMYHIFTKGAPEMVLAKSRNIMTNGNAVPITDAVKKQLFKANDDMANGAFRVLGVAGISIPVVQIKSLDEIDTATLERDLTFYGLVGIMDPPKLEV